MNGQATDDENLQVTSSPVVGPPGLGFEFVEALSFIDNDPNPLALVIAGVKEPADPDLPDRVLSPDYPYHPVILSFPLPFPNPKLSTL